MDKRKIKRPSMLENEADMVLALTSEKGVGNEQPLQELQDAAECLKKDMLILPMIGFSYKELYVIVRFLVMLNGQSAGMAHYVRDEDEKLLCDVLAAGIIEELDNYAVARMSNILDGIEITVMGGKRDGV